MGEDFETMAREQAELAHRTAEQGVGACPERGAGLGHVWGGVPTLCRFCGAAGADFLDAATAQRSELFRRLATPQSIKGTTKRESKETDPWD